MTFCVIRELLSPDGVQRNPLYPALFEVKLVVLPSPRYFCSPTERHLRSSEDGCLFTYGHLGVSVRDWGRPNEWRKLK